MEVVKFKNEEGNTRYYVADDTGIPVEPILKFIRFKDNTNYARNTLKMYCHHLKSYLEFLQQRGKDFREVTIDDLSLFVNWLQNPYQSLKVIPVGKVELTRSPKTVNIIVNTVLLFYDYALRHEEYSGSISERLKRYITVRGGNFKGFLYGIANEKKRYGNILKLKEKQYRPKTLTREEISTFSSLCSNGRDRFILILLYETGMRIGEVLSLWVEDFDINDLHIDLKDRGSLENQAEIKTVSSPRRIDISQGMADMFLDYICQYHTEDIATNHVFIKISGKNRNKAMNYIDVDNVFRGLEKKSGIHVTPHMFRHSSLTALRMAGWELELLRIRAGHKNIYTTMNTYVHPSEREVTEMFHKMVGVHDFETVYREDSDDGNIL